MFTSIDSPPPVPDVFSDDHVAVGDRAYIVASDEMTTDEIAKAFNMCSYDQPDDFISGLVIKMDLYSGCGDQKVVEKFSLLREKKPK
jgi:hypothetical protein